MGPREWALQRGGSSYLKERHLDFLARMVLLLNACLASVVEVVPTLVIEEEMSPKINADNLNCVFDDIDPLHRQCLVLGSF